MRYRAYWVDRILRLFESRSVVWLSGVRRAGKTVLCKSIPGVELFDCELPRVRHLLSDPEGFLNEAAGKTIILDEIHRLPDPSELLKIAADHFPDTRVVATGSSTLSASARFRDTLAGRKREVWLTPATMIDLDAFGGIPLGRRMLHGGLPPFLLSSAPDPRDFEEWLDGYWARDIQELFRLERRHSFRRFLELLLTHSGGIFEATRYASPCEISRTTVANYLAVLEATHVAHVVRPFSTHRATEIVSAPKVYGFDTGFVCHQRGWDSLRPDDHGPLWEHLVLNELHAHLQTREIRYWRDKAGHEVDFVIPRKKGGPIAIECKWRAAEFDPKNLKIFRAIYPEGLSLVVSSDVAAPSSRMFGAVGATIAGIADLPRLIGTLG